jgi:hypothetical protein
MTLNRMLTIWKRMEMLSMSDFKCCLCVFVNYKLCMFWLFLKYNFTFGLVNKFVIFTRRAHTHISRQTQHLKYRFRTYEKQLVETHS